MRMIFGAIGGMKIGRDLIKGSKNIFTPPKLSRVGLQKIVKIAVL
jgi:hypothetical protein